MGIGSLHPVTCLGSLQSLSLELWYGVQPAAAVISNAGTGSAQQQLISRAQHRQQLLQQPLLRLQPLQQLGSEQQQSLQLTRLVLTVPGLEFSSSPSSSLPSFAGLTALQDLHLEDCAFDPAVLYSMHSLEHLNFALVRPKGGLRMFFSSLRMLQTLTHVSLRDMEQQATDVPPAAYAALTSSSKLQSLYLTDVYVPAGAWQHMFPAQPQLTCLRSITLQMHGHVLAMSDLERIVACCPNLDRLILMFLPLQPPHEPNMQCLGKLRQLCFLQVNRMQDEVATVLPQLTNLRTLNIYMPGVISITTLLQLSSLTQLTSLSTAGASGTDIAHKSFTTKVRN